MDENIKYFQIFLISKIYEIKKKLKVCYIFVLGGAIDHSIQNNLLLIPIENNGHCNGTCYFIEEKIGIDS